MSRVCNTYYHCKLVECPRRWTYYKKIEDVPLVILKSEQKKLGKRFFCFDGLKSSYIEKMWIKKKTGQIFNIYIETEHSKYIFEWDKNYVS